MRLEKLFVALLSVITVLPSSRAVVAEEETAPPSVAVDARVSDDADPEPLPQPDDVEPTHMSPPEYDLSPLGVELRWEVSVDAIVLARLGTPNVSLLREWQDNWRDKERKRLTDLKAAQPFVILDNEGGLERSSGAEQLNSRDFDLGFQAGPRISLTRYLDQGYDVELSAFGINHWSSTRTRISDPQSLDPNNEKLQGLQFDAPGFSAVGFMTPMRFEWESRLYNLEVNLRWFDRPWIHSLIGFRYVQFEESLLGQFPAAVPEYIVPGDYILPAGEPNRTFWSSKVANHLWGGQLGTDITLWDRGGLLSASSSAKVGLYYNREEQTSSSPGLGVVSAQQDELAFLGEIGVMTKWRVTDRIVFRLGYQLMWLQGVALAPSQIPVSSLSGNWDRRSLEGNPTSVNGNGTLFFHGSTAGVEVKF